MKNNKKIIALVTSKDKESNDLGWALYNMEDKSTQTFIFTSVKLLYDVQRMKLDMEMEIMMQKANMDVARVGTIKTREDGKK